MTEDKDQRLYWFALQAVPGIGAVRFNSLVRRFGSPQAVLEAPKAQLAELPDFGTKLTAALKSEVDFDQAEKQMLMLEKSGAKLISILDPAYPKPLKQIYDPPSFLLVQGELTEADELSVGMVGSRSCTRYGRQIAGKVAADLAAGGLTVVSGLARGIDSAAHRGAIKVGGRTIGVLGCGLDVIYPPENGPLYDEVRDSGALISEFPFGIKPEKHNFPSRNRIISGLCRGVLLIEAGRASGALLTAKHALDQDREVMVVPGNIDSAASAGTNELLKEGAIPVTSTSDVLLALGLDPRFKPKRKATVPANLPDAERRLLGILSEQPQQVDNISMSIEKPIAQVLALLSNLELFGLVKQLPGKRFIKEI